MRRVLVIGNTHIDQLLKAATLPQPGETVIGEHSGLYLGGKGANQAVAASQHGAPTAFCSSLGDDHYGQLARQALAAAGVESSQLLTVHGAATGGSVAVVEDSGENFAVIYPAANLHLAPEHAVAAIQHFNDLGLMVCQLESRRDTLRAAFSAARARQLPMLLNAAPWATLEPELLECDYLVLNAVEFAGLSGTGLTDLAQTQQRLSAHVHSGTVIVTLGRDGCLWRTGSGPVQHLPAKPVNVINTHGAGDHFVGALAAALVRGISTATALEQATQAAARFVSQTKLPLTDREGGDRTVIALSAT